MPSVPGDERAAGGPITILITDAEGSTALHSTKGDAQARAVLDAGDRVVREQVEDQGGRVVISTGDGLMAAFSSPRQAVACALGVNQAITDHSQRNPQLAMRVHIGLHTGEVIEGEGDLHGAAVAAATRICARAKGGEILASRPQTRRAVVGNGPDGCHGVDRAVGLVLRGTGAEKHREEH
jgi:class 3 adenylate cyclase